ncbi:MAG: RNA pseudouridine synthase, partial [Candidatus Omnitrophica bacterium]|nr:RNA pseudouridine synthase [Candidatus Omnitrophota bacterium]
GLLTIPTPKNEQRTLTSILNEDLKKRGLTYRLHPAHRLDRETSGLIIYTKGKAIQKKMMAEFNQRRVKKAYLAFMQGLIKQDDGMIENPIEGSRAITKYKVIQRRKDFSIVEVMPLTGRTNQIRIHFKQIGHPVVGETKYAFRKDFKLKAKRLCLHAQGLEFIHPAAGKPITLKIDLSSDMQDFLARH